MRIKNEFIGQAQKENIHVNYFDENENKIKVVLSLGMIMVNIRSLV
jgi:hypothetical protein